jgi:para-nitrobenzyl esterase
MQITRRSMMSASAMAVGGIFTAGLARAIEPDRLFPIVDTAQGKVRGQSAGGISKFKGIRYGANTTGRNRFMPPTAPSTWAGVRDAFDYGQITPQMPESKLIDYTALIDFDIQPGGMGEDCLVLNLWSPALDRNRKLPVLVHLHGGGFYGGSGNSAGYDGEALARFGNCVVITINHRLGAFGFLNLTEAGSHYAHSGTVGMMDVVAALHWVKENVAGFGGDPSRVLVFGQSGGGAKTSTLMSMPSAKGLFHRAGVMSGAMIKLATAEQAQIQTHALLKQLGLTVKQADQLQVLPFTTILAAQATLEAGDRAKGEAPRSFSPSIDGDVLPINPFDPGAPAISSDIPMIVSTALDERAYRKVNFDLDEAGLRKFIAARVGDGRADDVLAMYRKDDAKATPFVLQARFDSDESFRKSAYLMADRKAIQGAAPIWSYLYAMPAPAFGGRYGTPHGSDVGPSLHNVIGGLTGTTPTFQRLADQLASAWVSFAATGDPNNARLPAWPAYKVPERDVMVFGEKSRVERDPRGQFREFWTKEPPLTAPTKPGA